MSLPELPLLVVLALLALALGACGEQRVVLFGAGGAGDGAPTDGASDAPVVVDVTNRDPERCGVDERHCEDDEYCVDGACICRQGLALIDGECVDTRADPEHCGAIGVVCPIACDDGACTTACPAGRMECEGACVDVSAHPLHCGECGRPCGAGRVCTGGVCEPFRPAACATCPCSLCGTRLCCTYPGGTDPICVDADTCATQF